MSIRVSLDRASVMTLLLVCLANTTECMSNGSVARISMGRTSCRLHTAVEGCVNPLLDDDCSDVFDLFFFADDFMMSNGWTSRDQPLVVSTVSPSVSH